MPGPTTPCIYVIAGPNGAGKSSLMGAVMRKSGADYFNPDLEATGLQRDNPHLAREQANSLAWRLGTDLLKRAIRERKTFAFETTLGGNTIPRLLMQAVAEGMEIRVWFAGLASPELHIKRVRARVAQGGHSIPEEKIRERFDRSRQNLIHLLPQITELRMFDNSIEADPAAGKRPTPTLILHLQRGAIVTACPPEATPDWAKPIREVAMRLHEACGRRSKK